MTSILRHFLLMLLIISDHFLNAQNLVPDPGFDDLTDCPYEDNQIHFARYWRSASNGTPDLFNGCSTGDWFRVPHAGHSKDSYQVPKSGSGYAYLAVYNEIQYDQNNTGNSEYIETPLLEPMKAGKEYFIEFYVSPDYNATFYYGYTDAIGLALADTFYYQHLDARQALSLEPAIENRGTLIKDTAGWTRISGCYLAKGGENFALVGNFRGTEETLVEFEEFTFPFINFFYIEDVLIRAFDPLPDTLLLCDGLPATVNAGFLDATYLWSTGGTDSILTISSPGMYSVEAFIGDCILHDTVMVLDTREHTFITDTVICQDGSVRLIAPLPGSTVWSDGHAGSEYLVASPGTYELTVTNTCGKFVFTTQVTVDDCSCHIYVPSVFTPNGDGVNDQLELFLGCDFDYQVRQFTIYDRWGSPVFQAKGVDPSRWDGYYKGRPMPSDVYVWTLEYDIIRNGLPDHRMESGDVSIIR